MQMGIAILFCSTLILPMQNKYAKSAVQKEIETIWGITFAVSPFFMKLDSEIKLQTTRSGGKGGQNVNKVETAVIALFDVPASAQLNAEQKEVLLQKLSNRMNAEGVLMVKAQTHRTQLQNKEEAVRRLVELVTAALKKKKLRIATKPSKAAKEKRVEGKKRTAERKASRQKFRPGHY